MIQLSRPPAKGREVREVCGVCGVTDRLGLGSCAACGSSGADSLLFIQTSARRATREVIEAWLVGALDGVAGRAEAREAAEGTRPLVELPKEAAVRAAARLGQRGVHAVAVPRGNAWKRIPPAFLALTGTVAGVGLHAGLTGTPAMLFLGPVFAALLLSAGYRRLERPVWSPDTSSVLTLPPGLEPLVRVTLAGLRPGRARALLGELTSLAESLQREPDIPPGDDMREATETLVRLSCDAAADLDRLDRALALLEEQPEDEPEHERDPSIARAERVRDGLAARLEEALATLTRARAATADPSAELQRAAERLAEETEYRAAAWREVERLTG